MPNTMSLTEIFGDPISTYSRRQALDDGALIDVSNLAREAGFRFPVALTEAAWADCVVWVDSDSAGQVQQSESGRLWDVLWMASLAARRSAGSEIRFSVLRVARDGVAVEPSMVALMALCGPGDDLEPVVVIMLPDED